MYPSTTKGSKVRVRLRDLHQKCARRTQEPVIYVAGNLFVLVCPLAYATDK